MPSKQTQEIISALQSVKTGLREIYSRSTRFLEREKKLIGIITADIDAFIDEYTNEEGAVWLDYCEYIELEIQGICHRLGPSEKATVGSPFKNLSELTKKLQPFLPEKFEPEITQAMIATETRRCHEQKELEMRSDFKKPILELFSTTAAGKRLKKKKLFISYAWPVGNKHEEAWTKDFVRYLAFHLDAAGLIVYLDQNQSCFGRDMQRFMTGSIRKADHVLVICDRTLQFKFEEDGLSGACFEYLQVVRRWREHRKQNFVIPICLNDECFVPGLVAKAAEISIYKDGYLTGLKQIIQRSYGFDRDEFEQLWPADLREKMNPESPSSPGAFSSASSCSSAATVTSSTSSSSSAAPAVATSSTSASSSATPAVATASSSSTSTAASNGFTPAVAAGSHGLFATSPSLSLSSTASTVLSLKERVGDVPQGTMLIEGNSGKSFGVVQGKTGRVVIRDNTAECTGGSFESEAAALAFFNFAAKR